MAYCKCNGCGAIATDLEWLATKDASCPLCQHKSFSLEFKTTFQFLANGATRIQERHPNAPGRKKRKVRRDHFLGLDPNEHGQLMLKESLIDAEGDRRYEIVIDPASGLIVHKCDEPLKRHQGHGSAKTKKDGKAK